MKATRYAKGLSKGILWLTSLALLLALVLPSDGTGVVQASPGPDTVTLRPDGPGDETDLTIGGTSPAPSNWESVDEATSDGDATYVEGGGKKYATDLYSLANTSLTGEINSVAVYINCKGTQPGVGACTRISTHGAARNGDEITLTTSYATYNTTYDINPETGEAWTWDEINALQAGVALKRPTRGEDSWCTQVWVDVDYTTLSTAIEIRAQDYSTAVTAITFPEGAPSATVSTPYNDADGSGSPQAFGTPSTPVVTLFNGGSVTYTIWYNITTFTNGIVSDEYYLINNKAVACTSADAITNVVTFDADTNTGTTIAAGDGNEKDLYLKITLSDVAGKTGISTLTILGEA